MTILLNDSYCFSILFISLEYFQEKKYLKTKTFSLLIVYKKRKKNAFCRLNALKEQEMKNC